MEVGDVNCDVMSGQIAIIPAGTKHSFSVRGNNRFIVADVPVALATKLVNLPPFINMDEGLRHYVLFLQHALKQQASYQTNSHNQRQMLFLLTQLLTQRYGEVQKIDKRIEIARHYLDNRLDKPVTLSEVALLSNLSIRQLTTLFRRYFGQSPQQYLLEQRMQLAWRLLSHAPISVQVVAERCGYSNLSAFSTRFSKHFGCAPSCLRNNST